MPVTVYSPNRSTVQVRRTWPLEPATVVRTVELVTLGPVRVAVTVVPADAPTSRYTLLSVPVCSKDMVAEDVPDV